jgi:Na+/melibiose symporter-like transporter
MASHFRARGLVGDVALVLGFLLLFSARVADDWAWFFGIFAAGLLLVVISLVAVPFESHVSWIGRAPLKDPSHELNVGTTEQKRKDVI